MCDCDVHFVATVECLIEKAEEAVCKNVYLAARMLATAKEKPDIPPELVSSIVFVLCSSPGSIQHECKN